jgi:hypothetical protein
MRQRGVRAVVAGMRLGKECRHLARCNAYQLQQAKTLRDYFMWIKNRNVSRQRFKGETSQRFSKKRNSNSWMSGGQSQSQYGGPHT